MTDRAPERWEYVPKSATPEMLNAAIDVDSFKLGDISPLGFRISPQMLFEQCWTAMLAAAPSPPALSGEAEEVAAHLRQLAEWVVQAVQHPMSPLSIDLGDIDTDELRKAAALIERQAYSLNGLAQAYADLDQTSRVKISDLQAELAEVRAALEPFAQMAVEFSAETGWSETDGLVIQHEEGGVQISVEQFNVGSLRAARRALASHNPGES